jgi:hypothetical protein
MLPPLMVTRPQGRWSSRVGLRGGPGHASQTATRQANRMRCGRDRSRVTPGGDGGRRAPHSVIASVSSGEAMRRREFITLLGGVAASPIAAYAQQPALPIIGVLGFGTNIQDRFYPFVRGLEKAGYADRQNVAVEYRGGTQRGQWREILTDFDRQKVTVIVAANDGPALEARGATTTIPIVFVNTALDPVKLGLVKSLNRPGGNVYWSSFSRHRAGSQKARSAVPSRFISNDSRIFDWRRWLLVLRGGEEPPVGGSGCAQAAAHCH